MKRNGIHIYQLHCMLTESLSMHPLNLLLFFLVYNREARKAVSFEMEKEECGENGISKILSDTEEAENIDAIISNLVKVRDFCHSKAKDNISVAQEKQKKQYDAKHNSFKVYITVLYCIHKY